MHLNETVTRSGALAAHLPKGLIGEERLARMAAAGERRAFEEIFARYHQELYRYCRAILGEAQDAHDALQSTMAIAMRTLPREERRVALRAWLYRVAHNEAVSILRRRQSPVDLGSIPEPAGPGVDLQAEERERLARLVADLHELPERHRGALVMRELSGLSYHEIATVIGASEGAARQVVYEARESMRELELGREMECESVRRALSERDGRVLRGRRLRAHLKACRSCSDYRAGISQRRVDLGALSPPLGPAAASTLLAGLLGGAGNGGTVGASGVVAGGAGGGAAALGGGGAALGGSAALKAVSIVSALAIGTGAAGATGVVHLPPVIGGPNAPPAASSVSGAGAATAAGATAAHQFNAGASAGATHASPPVADAHRGHTSGSNTSATDRGRDTSQPDGDAVTPATDSAETDATTDGSETSTDSVDGQPSPDSSGESAETPPSTNSQSTLHSQSSTHSHGQYAGGSSASTSEQEELQSAEAQPDSSLVEGDADADA
jgi:RNA polymerase sigma factor (sigma-70 family)